MTTFITTILPYIQVILSVILTTLILLQQSAAALGGVFGGDSFSIGVHTRRGSEKVLFNASITISILFVLSAFAALLLQV